MKKEFIMPQLNAEKFALENVITASGGGNVEQIMTQNYGNNLTTVKFADLDLKLGI